MSQTRVLFLCSQNSARSQLAEALLRHHAADRFEVYSAGVSAADEIHPYTLQVLEEVGVSTEGQYPKGLREYMGRIHFGYLIVVCSRAEEDCPTTFPGVGLRLSWLFEDPRAFEGTEEEKLEKFREVRDQIETRILAWLENPEQEIAELKALRDLERFERQDSGNARGRAALESSPDWLWNMCDQEIPRTRTGSGRSKSDYPEGWEEAVQDGP